MTISATSFSNIMANVSGNSGGNLETLNNVTTDGGRVRHAVATINLSGGTAGSVYAMARVPIGAVVRPIRALTTSAGSGTIEFGNANSATCYGAATSMGTANAIVDFVGPATGVPISTGYDGTTGSAVSWSAGGIAADAGDDVLMTMASACSGTLTAFIDYVID